MTSTTVFVVICLGLLTSLVMVVLALRAGRVRPVHVWPWGIAIAAITAAALFHGAIGIGVLVSGNGADALAVLMGTAALSGAVILAAWRPAWAGWTLVATGLAQPALLWLLQVIVGTPVDEGIPAEGMLAFYGVPAIITGVLLLLSTWHRRSATTVATPLSSLQ